MRIIIDMQGAQTESRFRGIGRYTVAFAKAVVENKKEHEVYLILSGSLPDAIDHIYTVFDGLLPKEHIIVWQEPGKEFHNFEEGDVHRKTREIIRESFIASLKPDIVHISSLFEGDDSVASIGEFDKGIATTVILYDLIPLVNPEHYLKPSPEFEKVYNQKIEYLMRADLLLAISDHSLNEGLEILKMKRGNIISISTAADSHFQIMNIDKLTEERVKKKFGIYRPFVLYAGGVDERKNIPRLIEAYADLQENTRQKHQLVFAGKINPADLDAIKRLMSLHGLKSDKVSFTGYITDIDLVYLYNLCELFVFPSWHEGFGLPALEAMCCGAPVIGANNSSLPEVIGIEDALFDPFSVDSIRNKIEEVLSDDCFKNKLRKNSATQVKKYNWNITAVRAIKGWEMIALNKICLDQASKDKNIQASIYAKTIDRLAEINKKSDVRYIRIISEYLAANENVIKNYVGAC